MRALDSSKIGVVGLGYVGLPLAAAFGRLHETVGYDLDETRVQQLREGFDRTMELSREELAHSSRLRLTADARDLAACNTFIVTVPTPVDTVRRPDLTALCAASRSIGKVLKRGDVVIYESTVYPGCTEEVCVPVLEAESGLKLNVDFYCGYSPERANPGDQRHRLTNIVKVTAGSTPEAAEYVDRLYASIISAGTHRTSSIRIAEAAKVIENTQRDVNIALINEIAILFNQLGIDTTEVLEAAGTKWNFLPFRPGLVGGHCIGVDPYYLTHKAQEIGYHPEVILAGRRINDNMGAYVAGRIVQLLLQHGVNPIGSRVLVLGLAFKENCPDLRNSKVIDIVTHLKRSNLSVDIHDPWVTPEQATHEYGVELTANPACGEYDAVVLAVGHRQFAELGPDGVRAFGKPAAVVYDVKSVLPRETVDERL